VQQRSYELIINIHIYHLQYVFHVFNANYEIKDNSIGYSPILQHDINKSLFQQNYIIAQIWKSPDEILRDLHTLYASNDENKDQI